MYFLKSNAFFDNKVQAFVRKTRGKQLGRVLFGEGVGGVPPSILHKKAASGGKSLFLCQIRLFLFFLSTYFFIVK